MDTLDISYLLVLQNLRESMPEWISEFMSFITKLAVGYWPLAVSLLIFWVFDRKAGRKILGGFALGIFFNGLLKASCCVLRPWIRDARVEPWGDAKVAATGYSFPSGHSTAATANYCGWAAYLRKRRVRAAVLCCVITALTMFSRNYLGVHTPQDVLVGCASTLAMMFLIAKIEDWSDRKSGRDLYILFIGILLCAAAVCYFMLKPYELVYKENGSLLFDPKNMKEDCLEGTGLVLAYIIGRFVERRAFRFDTELSRRERIVFSVVAIIAGYFIFQTYGFVKSTFGPYCAKFMHYSVIIVYGMIVVPLFMHLYARCIKKKRK